jgi:hypothetical protein
MCTAPSCCSKPKCLLCSLTSCDTPCHRLCNLSLPPQMLAGGSEGHMYSALVPQQAYSARIQELRPLAHAQPLSHSLHLFCCNCRCSCVFSRVTCTVHCCWCCNIPHVTYIPTVSTPACVCVWIRGSRVQRAAAVTIQHKAFAVTPFATTDVCARGFEGHVYSALLQQTCSARMQELGPLSQSQSQPLSLIHITLFVMVIASADVCAWL